MNAVAEILPPATDIMLAVEETSQIVLLDAEKFDQFFERVKAETDGLVVDLSTKKGRDEIRSMAAKVTRSKTMIDKAGLALTKQWRDQTNQVNAARKEIEARLEALADEVRRPLTEWEDAEKARVNACREIIDSIKRSGVVTLDDTAASVRERGKMVWDTPINPDQFGDMAAEAQAAKDTVVEALKSALARLTREEEERAELERLRAEAAEREAREQAEREARERAEQEAEQARITEERRIDWQDAYFTALEKLKTETLEPADMSVLWGRVKAVTMAFDALRAHADALAEALGDCCPVMGRAFADPVGLKDSIVLMDDFARAMDRGRTALANYSAWRVG